MPPVLLGLLRDRKPLPHPRHREESKLRNLQNGGTFTFTLSSVFVNKTAGMAFRCGETNFAHFTLFQKKAEAQSLDYRTCGSLITQAKIKIGFAGSS